MLEVAHALDGQRVERVKMYRLEFSSNTGGRSCVRRRTLGSWLMALPSLHQRRVCNGVTPNSESRSGQASRNVSMARVIVDERSRGLVLCVWR